MRLLSLLVLIMALGAAPSAGEPGYRAEAPLPVGWPEPGAPGEIQLVMLPAVRAAEAGGFWPLFVHISDAGIPMTAPVTMPLGSGTGRSAGMRFLYPSASTPAAATRAGVRVLDQAAAPVLRIAHRGAMTSPIGRGLLARLREAAAERGLAAAGEPMLFGYNGPSTRASQRTWEVVLPVAAATAAIPAMPALPAAAAR